jgi:hypothetical protein
MIGRPLESLTLAERWKWAGKWVALEMYSPQTVPLRNIEAIGNTATECVAVLKQRGLDPERYELQPLPQPYQP